MGSNKPFGLTGHGRVVAGDICAGVPGAVIKVIAVDDDSFMRDLLQRVLVGAGMQVASYGSAAEMLKADGLGAATVLLLDVKMPGLSGLDLQDLLKLRGVDLPIVFDSGAADLGLAVTAMRNGANPCFCQALACSTICAGPQVLAAMSYSRDQRSWISVPGVYSAQVTMARPCALTASCGFC